MFQRCFRLTGTSTHKPTDGSLERSDLVDFGAGVTFQWAPL